ncbi:MAG: hypothetical protein WD552_01680 [Candidatus Paceibacterota bacterium]
MRAIDGSQQGGALGWNAVAVPVPKISKNRRNDHEASGSLRVGVSVAGHCLLKDIVGNDIVADDVIMNDIKRWFFLSKHHNASSLVSIRTLSWRKATQSTADLDHLLELILGFNEQLLFYYNTSFRTSITGYQSGARSCYNERK